MTREVAPTEERDEERGAIKSKAGKWSGRLGSARLGFQERP